MNSYSPNFYNIVTSRKISNQQIILKNIYLREDKELLGDQLQTILGTIEPWEG
jgi:hypothetical protein